MKQINVLGKSIKGQTREYRKALRNCGIQHFPTHGAFHVVQDTDRNYVVTPDCVTPLGGYVFVLGPAPMIKLADTKPIGYHGEETDPCRPTAEPVPDLPPLPDVTVYKKTSGVRANGKPYTNYVAVKNPKSGAIYFVRTTTPEGRTVYVEKAYADILAA